MKVLPLFADLNGPSKKEVIAAVLGCSQLYYVEDVHSQKKKDSMDTFLKTCIFSGK